MTDTNDGWPEGRLTYDIHRPAAPRPSDTPPMNVPTLPILGPTYDCPTDRPGLCMTAHTDYDVANMHNDDFGRLIHVDTLLPGTPTARGTLIRIDTHVAALVGWHHGSTLWVTHVDAHDDILWKDFAQMCETFDRLYPIPF